MNTIFLISTKAGNVTDSLEHEIISTYREAGRPVQIYKTQYPEHLSELAEQLSNEECIIYVCGGDGSLSEAVSKIVNKKATLGLLPLGTANDFAKNFDYSEFNIKDTLDPKIRKYDVIKVNDSYSINILSFGFDTTVLYNTYSILKHLRFLKASAYPLGVLKSVFNFSTVDVEMNLTLSDGNTLTLNDEYLLGAVCNGGYYGGGFNPSPNANVSDGILELCLGKKMNLLQFASLVSKYKNGTHIGDKNIDFYSVTSGTIKSKEKILANTDGKIFKANEINFEILKSAINFVEF